MVALTLLGLAAAIRLWDLGDPDRLYFDEKYYAVDASDYLAQGVEEGRPAHPPMGKWVIAAGLELFGSTPFGWRVGVAVAGSVTVLLTYLSGLRLFRRTAPAALAAVLVALDGLAVTASRMAMLDAVLALFVVAAFWLALLDRDARRRTRKAGEGLRRSFVGSRYRWLAGVTLGLAVATKWSGLLAVGLVGLLVLGTELSGRGEPFRQATRRAVAVTGGAVLSLLMVPAAVYLATFTGWFANYSESYAAQRACEAGECGTSVGDRLETWAQSQVDLVDYHVGLEASHPYRSSPLGWPWLERPVLVYAESCTTAQQEARECEVPPDTRARIVMLGNPGLWWPALLAYPVLLWRAVARRDGVAATVLVPLVLLWAPWLAANKPGYFFYMVPVVPFIALALVRAVQATRRPRLVGAVALALSVAGFAFFAPVWLGLPLESDALELRFWLDSWD
ncbi:phospholipid carrier-dependent glycosyltransferase [Modestobacter sp. VKM Ac-2979]|uniref:phospholipid carrier-dependent glycosyltransferase n=1 Tax=unclassified Modestobacter TaxID=2643866 RepID=UPI0022ABB728|nr:MULTISPECIES: phospholipid carrier-dependent glycosyltransferase [unclassified Modestobacter]MCZ2811059.1 phospholipid carrier-dependent glycosyltransferase [Modestobacter sp. VKM Ac-2979]MCZ2840572.1 phospholipid carrier-dependent glycosyltransferase [Modestobacter sp. VKM Ac-2980]